MRKYLLLLCLAAVLPIYALTTPEAQDSPSMHVLVTTDATCYRHGYSLLNQTEKEQYEYVLGRLLQFEANKGASIYHRVDLPEVPYTSAQQQILSTTLECIHNDVPEMYIQGPTIARPDYDNYVWYARVMLAFTPESYLSELRQLDSIAALLSASLTSKMTGYQKLLALHDAFIEYGDYGDMSGAYAGSIKGALINKKGVCEGFSRAFLYLCQKNGLKCIYVGGQLLTGSETNTWGNHAWNYVELNGQWYLVDCTTDGGFPNVVGHSAFLRGQDYFSQNYRLTDADGLNPNSAYKSLPTLASTTYVPTAADLAPVTPDPVTPDPVTPDPVDPQPVEHHATVYQDCR